MARRRSPTFFRRKGTAIGVTLILFAALIVGVYTGIGFLTRYDFAGVLPEDAELRATFSEEGYIPVTPPPTPVPVVTPTPLPTPMPTPALTPIPLDYFSSQDTRMVMPGNATAPGEASITDIFVSEADGNRAVRVTGWAYLDGCDAEQSTIYLVTSSLGESVRRFYKAAILPGSTGIQHDSSRGQNLERADFRAVFNVRIYEEGPYKLGLLVVNQPNRKTVTRGYFDLDDAYQFYVKSNAVTSVG